MRTWRQIKPQVEAELAAVKDELIVAPIDKVPTLQVRAAVLAQVINWFEAGAPSERQISDDSPVKY